MLLSAAALMAACSITAHAQDDWNIALDELEIVSDRPMKEAGIVKTRIDSMALRGSIAQSLADVLSKNSTLFVKNYGRATESTAEFRGTSPSHTQVVWNGMKINSPILGTVDFSTIPAFFIDDATLYHGASSIGIAGGGLGGAIEMQTRSDASPQDHLQYVQGIGSFRTFDQFLRLNYGSGKWSMSTRGVYSTSKNDFPYTNYDKKIDVKDDGGNIIDSYHPREKNKSGYFDDAHIMQEIYYDATPSDRISLTAWYNHSKRGLPFLSVDYKDDSDFRNESTIDVLRSVLSWRHVGDNWLTTARAGHVLNSTGYNYYTSRPGAQTNITQSQSNTNSSFLQAQGDLDLSERVLLTAGTQLFFNHVDSRDKSPFHTGQNFNRWRTDGDINAQLRWRPAERITLSGVLRQEFHGGEAARPIPALFADLIICKPINLVLKSSVARNYRFPSMDDLYFQPGGNPDLKPEEGFTYDAGFEMAMKRQKWNLKASVQAFNSEISDWILWTPDAKGYWRPSNVKKVHSYGVESSFNAAVLLNKSHRLSLTGNYAWTPSKNLGEKTNSNDTSYGRQLCYVPIHSANIGVRSEWHVWSVWYQWQYYSERFTTTSNETDRITGRLIPYFNSDLTIERKIYLPMLLTDYAPVPGLRPVSPLSVKLVISNLLGSEYVTVLSRPMPQRNAELFITLHF